MGCFEQEEEAKNSPEKATAAAGVVTRESFSSAIVVGKRHIETCHLHHEERWRERSGHGEREGVRRERKRECV